jgi:hypothetical protein
MSTVPQSTILAARELYLEGSLILKVDPTRVRVAGKAKVIP